MLLLRNGFFDLLSQDALIFQSFRLKDVTFVVEIAWVVYSLFIFKGIKCKNTFYGLIWSILLIIMFSCVICYIIFDQPISLGFLAQRDIFSGYACFFSISTLLYKKKISKNELYNILFYVGVIQLFFNTFGWLLYSLRDINGFPGAVIATERYGSARIWYSQYENIVLVIAISINELLNRKDKIIRYFILIGWGIAYFAIMTKLRASSLAVLIALILTLVISKKMSKMKLFVFCFFVIGMIIALNRIPLFQDIVLTFFSGDSASANTLTIRHVARKYYLTKFMSSPIFGFGVPHSNWYPAFLAQGKDLGYYFSDNGIFAFMYLYGGVGIMWLLFLLKRYWQRMNVYRRINNVLFVFWGLYQLMMLPTGMFWMIGNYQLPFVAILALLSKYPSEKLDGTPSLRILS